MDGVSFGLTRGRTLVVIGESGSGKSSLARAILRLLPRNVHTYTGRVFLGGTDVMRLDEERFRREVRWLKVALVPQAAMNSLNPVIRVEEQVAEPLLIHRRVTGKKEALERVKEVFRLVGVPADFLNRYPFELSGGMRQRAAIAMALVMQPELVLLDEPTSALDVLTQANLMNVLKRIKRDLATTFILITHDIAAASELADDVAVMYAGQVVELADAARFYQEPLHPYSKKLMGSVPTLREEKALAFIPGQPPSLINPPGRCRFADRCPARFARCEEEPPPVEVEDGRWVKCWLHR
ncbi:MAG: ABC transporter ATP-binding protein [Bacillota bacterium]